MKKRHLIPIIVVGLFIMLTFDYIYFPIIGFKARESALNYLKSTYQEEFVIEGVSYSKAIGDKSGVYYIIAHPKDEPGINIYAHVSQDFNRVTEDYKEAKWRYELNQEYLPFINGLYDGRFSYMVNVSIPEEAIEKNSVKTPFSTIFNGYHKQTSEALFMNVFLDGEFNQSRELEKIYKVMEYMKERDLKHYAIEMMFYPPSLHKTLTQKELSLNYHDFNQKYSKEIQYIFRFNSGDRKTVEILPNIRSANDLAPFLFKPKH